MCRPLTFDEFFAPNCFGSDSPWLRPAVLSLVTAFEAHPDTLFSRLGAPPCRCDSLPHLPFCPAFFSSARGRLAQAAKRLCRHPDLSPGCLLAPAIRATASRIAASPRDSRWLCVHDGSEFDLTAFPSMKGVGELDAPHRRGVKFLSSIVLDDRGVCFGPAQLQCWTRPIQARRVRRRGEAAREHHNQKVQRNRQRAFEAKESFRWWTAIQQVEAAIGESGRALHIIDAGGDVYELFERAAGAGASLLVRSGHERAVEGPDSYLWATTGKMEPVDRKWIFIPARPARKGKPARAARWAQLQLRFGPVTLKQPHGRQGRLVMGTVRVGELNPPAGEEAIEWLLLTNEPVLTVDDAWARVDWYRWRWRIEDYHKILKSNCRMEERRFATREQFERALELYIVVATKLLAMRDLARVEPQTPAVQMLEPLEVEVLQVTARVERLGPLSAVPTLEEAVRILGRLGGHQGRKSDGPVGWQTLSRGYAILQERIVGYQLAMDVVRGKNRTG